MLFCHVFKCLPDGSFVAPLGWVTFFFVSVLDPFDESGRVSDGGFIGMSQFIGCPPDSPPPGASYPSFQQIG